jgi:transaldolase
VIADKMKVKIFADGADLANIKSLASNKYVRGFTTNPSLMRKAGVVDYQTFAKDVQNIINGRPVSFEVFSDDFEDMYRQAKIIAGWGANVYAKIPVTNTKGQSTVPLLKRLVADGVQTNVTALMTVAQVHEVVAVLGNGPAAYVSVFAGRIADTGCDPIPVMQDSVKILAPYPNLELIWASSREAYNIVQADLTGCHIITVTTDQLAKVDSFGKDLNEFSLDTVKTFYKDAQAAGFKL